MRESLLLERQRQAAKLKADVEGMLRLYLDGSVSSEEFKQFNDPLSRQRKEIDEEVVRLQGEVDILKIDNLSSEQLIAEATELHGSWPEMTPERKRQVIEQMVKKLTIGNGEIDTSLVQLPSYKEITNWQNTYRHAHTAGRSSRGSGAECRL